MIEVTDLTFEQMEQGARAAGLTLPIEQTELWSRFEATVPGRSPWGACGILRDGAPMGFVSFIQYETHGYRYLRAHHAPLWVGDPTDAEVDEALGALAAHLHKRDRKQVFVRLAVGPELERCCDTLSTLPYDTTVVVDLTGGDEEILGRMKPRGRRDVRKALRESPVECADETERAIESFEEYHALMRETAERDGFSCAPLEYFQNLIRTLGAEHCRVFAGRIDGELVTWAIDTLYEGLSVHYYAASKSGSVRAYATDKLVFFECQRLAELGVTAFDLMGIGSDRYPDMLTLNKFKTKFSKETVPVAPDRDLPLRPRLYGALVTVKRLRDRKSSSSDEEKSE